MDKRLILGIDATESVCKIKLLDQSWAVLSGLEISEPRSLSEKILTTIDQLLIETHFRLSDLSAISVNPGPGSYTSLRIAVTTANSLAFALNIPVIEKEKDFTKKFTGFVLPKYKGEPVITKKKPRL